MNETDTQPAELAQLICLVQFKMNKMVRFS